MKKFENRFLKVIQEDIEDQISPDEMSPEDDELALQQTFDDPSEMEEFQTDTDTPGFETRYVEKAKGWLNKIIEFSEWLNSPDGDSLNKQLISMDKEGSPFEGISNETKRITGMAQDLVSLAEQIKGAILNVEKRKREMSRMQY